METVPGVMRVIIKQMRRRKPADLSHPQFRVLIFLSRHGGVSLSHLAEHNRVTPPTMSKMIQALVTRGLVSRERAPDDRRRVILDLTDSGRETLAVAQRAARRSIAALLAALTEDETRIVSDAMQSLGRAFSGAHEEDEAAAGVPGHEHPKRRKPPQCKG